MSRGDQRERDRAKAQAKLAQKNEGAQKEGRPEQRNANDAAALQAKVAAKAAKKKEDEEKAANAGSGPVARKAKPKKQDDLDDLLNAGLSGNKKKGGKAK